ncbi:MAG: hypothetical protein WC511_02570 [Candidatus Pacearchaeota archaeon]
MSEKKMILTCRRCKDMCDLEEFLINGVPASYLDFGVTTDLDDTPIKGCGNRQFIADEEISLGVLNKYQITQEEAEIVLDVLRKELSMGNCSFCVTTSYGVR